MDDVLVNAPKIKPKITKHLIICHQTTALAIRLTYVQKHVVNLPPSLTVCNLCIKSINIQIISHVSVSCAQLLVLHHVQCVLAKYDCVCDNQPCQHKLHLVRYSLISSVLKEVFAFYKLQRFSIKFFICSKNCVLLA